MKKSILLLSLVLMFFVSCQNEEINLLPFDDGGDELIENCVSARQITDDVNSKEVDNILDKLFKGKPKSRAGYTISLLKDKQGKDAIICVNFAGNGGFALISAVKTHEPILAYSEEGNFNDVDSLKFPLNEWLKDAIEDVSSSIELPEDSLRKILSTWRIYEEPKSKLKSRVYDYGPDKSKLVNIPYEKYIELSRVILELTGKWQADGDRVYAIDEYPRNLSMGDKLQIAGYVQGSIYPGYIDDYWAVTVVRERDIGYDYYEGSRFETEWDQLSYNQSFDLVPGGYNKRIPVGCGPIAVGQVMYYFKHPDYFNWGNMTLYEKGNEITSDFLYDVYKKCNAYYIEDKDATACTDGDMVNALKKYGYDCKKIKSVDASDLEWNFPTIMNSKIKYINDKGKEDEDGHAWVIECELKWGSYTTVEIWTFVFNDEFKCIYEENVDFTGGSMYYVNWGWGHYSSNGYYNFSNLKPKGDKYLKSTIQSAIINIKPNK